MICFKERLKSLRKEKDFTQEELAEYMGVSPQAVSRWETGATCPDISLLPQLAALFHISVDALLGVNQEQREQEISEVIEKAEKEVDQGITEAPIGLLREALVKYPYDDRLLCSLMYALYVEEEEENPEIVTLAQRIFRYSENTDCINEARRLLFRHYCDVGRVSEALEVVKTLPSVEACREYNLYWALQGEARLRFLENRMAEDWKQLSWDIWAYETHGDFTREEKEKLGEFRGELEERFGPKFNFWGAGTSEPCF